MPGPLTISSWVPTKLYCFDVVKLLRTFKKDGEREFRCMCNCAWYLQEALILLVAIIEKDVLRVWELEVV